MEINRILVPVDLSEPSIGALGMAIPLAEMSGAAVTLLTVDPIVFAEYDAPALPFDQAALEEKLRGLYTEWKRHHPHYPNLDHQMKFLAKSGFIVQEILHHANEVKADMIVMATHCRKGLKRMILGSVTEEVIRQADCPVLAVPPQAWDEPVAQPFQARGGLQ